MRSRIFAKLLLVSVLVIAAATAVMDVAITRAWKHSLHQEIETALSQKVRLLAARVESDPSPQLQQIARQAAGDAQARVTVIDRNGKVLADSEADPVTMENHASRPEFAAALAGKQGLAVRTSATVGVDFLYVAVPLRHGAVRLAHPLSAIHQATARVRRTVLWSSGLALAVALLLSAIAAQSLARRLRGIEEFAVRVAGGDLSARIAERSSDEVGKLASALDSTANRLQQSFQEIQTARQQLETVLNSMQEGVIAVSADRRVRWANGLMDRLTTGGVKLGAPLVETIRDPDFLHAIEEALATGVVCTARATSILSGRSYYITATPMPGSGAVAVLYDVTEIERVEKTRRDFIANVSHELRTPLTSIQGYAETLLDSMRNGAEREFLEIIRKNAARMSRLTEDLLTLARVESGEASFSLQPVAPADLLHDAEQNFREICKARGLELVLEAQTTRSVSADRDAIHQVLANLLDNAVKYGASGGKIIVGARDAGNAVEFYVRDFGAGLASEHLPRLFERFYRVDKARSVESGGTGLGLAIAKHIVRAHGGSIRAESALGHGATFIFALALATSIATSLRATQPQG